MCNSFFKIGANALLSEPEGHCAPEGREGQLNLRRKRFKVPLTPSRSLASDAYRSSLLGEGSGVSEGRAGLHGPSEGAGEGHDALAIWG